MKPGYVRIPKLKLLEVNVPGRRGRMALCPVPGMLVAPDGFCRSSSLVLLMVGASVQGRFSPHLGMTRQFAENKLQTSITSEKRILDDSIVLT